MNTQPAMPISDVLVPDEDLLLPWGADKSTVRGRLPRLEEPVPFLHLVAITAGIAVVTPLFVLPMAVLFWLVGVWW